MSKSAEAANPLLTAEQICGALDISPATLKRWLQQGAPQARRGRRGRGGAALYDLDALRAWRQQRGGSDALLVLSTELPEIIAAAMYESFRLADGSHKRPSAGLLAACWYLTSTRVLDHIRESVPHVRDVETVPELIEWLQRIEREDHIDTRRERYEWSAWRHDV